MSDIRTTSSRLRRLVVAIGAVTVGAVGVVGVDAAPVEAAVAQFAPLSPARLMDTRQMGGPMQSGSVFELLVAGQGGVAFSADAVSLNVTVTGPAGDGFVTLWPCGTPRPNASTLNYSTGVTRANHAIAKIGASGNVCVYVQVTTHVIVDVTGYFPAGAGFVPLTPGRLTDTRSTGGPSSSVDGREVGAGPGREFRIQVAGRGGVPGDAKSVALNVAVVSAQADGFVTLYPCGVLPDASTLNYFAGQTVANAAVTSLDSTGGVCAYSFAATDIIVDVTGWFAANAIDTVAPYRVMDTRQTGSQNTGRRSAGTFVRVQIAGQGPVPAGVAAGVVNVTAVAPSGDGFLTLYPCGARPDTSALNYQTSRNVANLAVTALDASGAVCIFESPWL